MKKLLLASAVAALSVSAAQAAPTVYGKAFLTLDAQSNEEKTTDKVANTSNTVKSEHNRAILNSNSSRIGLKGSEALSANTDLVYQLEYGIKIDESKKSEQFKSRDTYIGLSNAELGTVLAGRLTGIDDEVNYADMTVSAGASSSIVGGGDRHNNALAYASPDYNGMQFLAMYALDEDTTGREGFGAAAKYEQDAMKVGASYIQLSGKPDVESPLKSALRISGSYDVTPTVTVGALYQLSDFDTDNKENAISVGGELATATPWSAYAQGEMVSNVAGAKDADAFNLVVGGKYAFNKATTAHVYGGFNKQETENAATKVEETGFGIGGGIEYKF